MGNTQNNPNPPNAQEDAIKINHQKFIHRQILKSSPEETLILIKLSVPHQKEYTTWVEQLGKTDSHESLLLPKSHQFKKEGFCGLSGVVEIIFQNYPFLLSDQINNRYCMGTKYFEESQLWYLVLTLLCAAELFHSKNKKVGDIRPENVFISEDGSVKVACMVSWPLQRTNYEKSFQKQTTYIAPEQTDDLRFGKLDPSSNFKLAQTFSIGLTLLDAATLSDSRDIYKSQSSIDYDTLEQRLKELQQNQEYSKLLRSVITNMCQVKPENRTSCQQLFQWISPFEEQINNFQPFEPAEVPQKIKAGLLVQSQIKPPQPPISNSQYNQTQYNHTYVSNTYVQPYQTTTNVTFNQQPQFSHQSPQIPASTYIPAYEFASVPVRKTYQLPLKSGAQTSIGNNYSESAFTGFSGKFSLQKIDEQLQQSRKMFPS